MAVIMSKKKKNRHPVQKIPFHKPSTSGTGTAPPAYVEASAGKENLLLLGCLVLTFARQ
jgi:hypothetical protein